MEREVRWFLPRKRPAACGTIAAIIIIDD